MTFVNAIPDYQVTVDGVDITPRLKGKVQPPSGGRPRPRLVALTLTDKREGQADELTLQIDDSDGAAPLPKIGAAVTVSLGWLQGSDVTPGLVDKGRFIIDEVAHDGAPDVISVTARSADFTGAATIRRERSWAKSTLGAIVSDVAKAHGWKPRCAARLAGIAITAKAQSRESDLAFLRRLGREHDAVATIKAGVLIMSPIGAGETATGRSLPAVTLTRRVGDKHGYRVAKRDDAPGVTAVWHDRGKAKRHEVTAGTADGAKKLARVYTSEAEAKRAAEAERKRAARQAATLDLTLALGRADLYPEQRVIASSFKAEIDATTWLIAEATHELGEQGYFTRIKLESAN
ncbi:contractile injection system protein, VgrG/Pvc8 family [Sphingomonas sp. SORGH_AS_0438]|uniref:contractile injection system protein, VgrG/Pvc8 family n=1 Tax=Sphingomonas sp. SORGH_AS_0438 TaxID=3041756 RepID=UPI002858A31E|nr:contractile injection system protein, VgrG/Pvc8 family [Sphingomonas sp. SORGH_AS_0438]MDR6128061.1 phage protein D [Sphingomonas sp. SORGH_AS_0438]